MNKIKDAFTAFKAIKSVYVESNYKIKDLIVAESYIKFNKGSERVFEIHKTIKDIVIVGSMSEDYSNLPCSMRICLKEETKVFLEEIDSLYEKLLEKQELNDREELEKYNYVFGVEK